MGQEAGVVPFGGEARQLWEASILTMVASDSPLVGRASNWAISLEPLANLRARGRGRLKTLTTSIFFPSPNTARAHVRASRNFSTSTVCNRPIPLDDGGEGPGLKNGDGRGHDWAPSDHSQHPAAEISEKRRCTR